jgi:hypothetical protein
MSSTSTLTHDELEPITSRRRGAAFYLTLALAVILIAALVISVIEWQHYENKADSLSSVQATQSSALKAATSYGVYVGSYNYTDLHGPTAPWTLIENNATPDFKAKYQQTTSLLESTVLSYKGSATATVAAAAVSKLQGSTATVLIELNQSITNSTQKNGPQSETFLVTMTLVRQKGHWLISSVAASV